MTQFLTRLMILSLAGSASVAARAQPSQDHPYGWHGGGDWGHMIFGPLMMLVFVAVVIVVVVLAGHDGRDFRFVRKKYVRKPLVFGTPLLKRLVE